MGAIMPPPGRDAEGAGDGERDGEGEGVEDGDGGGGGYWGGVVMTKSPKV